MWGEHEDLQFRLEEAKEWEGSREMEVTAEEPGALPYPSGKVLALQVGDVAIAACCGMGGRRQHSILLGASGLWAGQDSTQHGEPQAPLGNNTTFLL